MVFRAIVVIHQQNLQLYYKDYIMFILHMLLCLLQTALCGLHSINYIAQIVFLKLYDVNYIMCII